MKVKFKNGYEAEMKDDVAKIMIKKGRVEAVKAPVKAAPKKDVKK